MTAAKPTLRAVNEIVVSDLCRRAQADLAAVKATNAEIKKAAAKARAKAAAKAGDANRQSVKGVQS